jgi:hypothetical protein
MTKQNSRRPQTYTIPYPIAISTLIERQYANDLEDNGDPSRELYDIGIVSFKATADFNIKTVDYALDNKTAESYQVALAPEELLEQLSAYPYSNPPLFVKLTLEQAEYIILEKVAGANVCEMVRIAPAWQVRVDIEPVDTTKKASD